MGLILLGILFVLMGFVVNVLDILPGSIMRTVGWVLIIVGVVLAFLDLLRDAARYRPRGGILVAEDANVTFIVWGIGLIVVGLLFDVFLAGGGILRTVGWVMILVGILLTLVDIAREPRHRTWRYA